MREIKNGEWLGWYRGEAHNFSKAISIIARRNKLPKWYLTGQRLILAKRIT